LPTQHTFGKRRIRCRANVAHIRQSRQDSGLGFQVKVARFRQDSGLGFQVKVKHRVSPPLRSEAAFESEESFLNQCPEKAKRVS